MRWEIVYVNIRSDSRLQKDYVVMYIGEINALFVLNNYVNCLLLRYIAREMSPIAKIVFISSANLI